MDITGTIIRVDEGTSMNGIQNFHYSMPDLAKGMYFIAVEKGNDTKVLKLILQ